MYIDYSLYIVKSIHSKEIYIIRLQKEYIYRKNIHIIKKIYKKYILSYYVTYNVYLIIV